MNEFQMVTKPARNVSIDPHYSIVSAGSRHNATHDVSMPPTYGESNDYTHVFSHVPRDGKQCEIARDRAVIRTSKNNDFIVYAKHDDTRHMVGMVRKTDTRILYRLATDNGLGAWHVVRGYTKRLPNDVMHKIFHIQPYITAYMVDVRQIERVTMREDTAAIQEYGPHDRRPQTYNYKTRYPKKRGW